MEVFLVSNFPNSENTSLFCKTLLHPCLNYCVYGYEHFQLYTEEAQMTDAAIQLLKLPPNPLQQGGKKKRSEGGQKWYARAKKTHDLYDYVFWQVVVVASPHSGTYEGVVWRE